MIWKPITSTGFVNREAPVDVTGAYRRPAGPLPTLLVKQAQHYDDVVAGIVQSLRQRADIERRTLESTAELVWDQS